MSAPTPPGGPAVPTDVASAVAPYPTDADRVVRDAAREHGRSDVVDVLDTIRDLMLGDAPLARDRAVAWGNTPFLGDSATRVADARIELAAYWEGAAYESFDRYAARFVDVAEANGGVHAEVAATLERTIETIFFTYGTALRLLLDCASAIIKAQGTTASNLLPWNWGDAPREVADVLSEFAKHFANVVRDVLRQSGEFVAQGVAFDRHGGSVDPPPRMPGAPGHVGNWEVVSAW